MTFFIIVGIVLLVGLAIVYYNYKNYERKQMEQFHAQRAKMKVQREVMNRVNSFHAPIEDFNTLRRHRQDIRNRLPESSSFPRNLVEDIDIPRRTRQDIEPTTIIPFIDFGSGTDVSSDSSPFSGGGGFDGGGGGSDW